VAGAARCGTAPHRTAPHHKLNASPSLASLRRLGNGRLSLAVLTLLGCDCVAEADRERRAHQLRHVITAGRLSKRGAKFAYKYAKIGAQAVATVAKKELEKVKDKQAAKRAAYLERQRQQQKADGEEEEVVKVGEAVHVSSKALVSASSGEGFRDLRTGKKLVW
jgi:hypothetical protein